MNPINQDNSITPLTNAVTGEVTPLGNIVNQPANAAPKRYDYLPMYASGMSTEEINANTQDGKIVPMSHDDAYARYKGPQGIYKDMTDDQFNKLYTDSQSSYNAYSQNKFNGKVAPLWQYEGQDGLSGKIDLNTPATGAGWTNPGTDPFGTPTATPGEAAAARGYIIDDNGKKVPYKEPGFLSNMWTAAVDTASLVAAPLAPVFAPLLLGNDPTKVTTIQQDDQGQYILKNVGVDDPSVMRSNILSNFGPQPMKQNWMTGLVESVYNGLAPEIYSATGSILQTSDNLFDFFSTGKDKDGWADKYGRLLQNFAAESTAPVSVEGSKGAFSNVQSTINSIGGMIPLILLTEGASAGIGAIPGVTATAAHMAGSFGVFTALGIDGYNQAAKEAGIDPANAAWQAMLVGAAQGALGLWAGPKFLTRGLEDIELKNGVKDLCAAELKKGEAFIGKRMVDMTPEEQKQVTKSVSSKLSEWFKSNIVPIGQKMSGTDMATTAGKILNAGHGGGSMMAFSMEAPMIVMQTFNDWQALMKDPSATPGHGMFENYDTNRTFLGQVAEKAPSRMIKAYATGFLGSLVMGLPGAFAKSNAESINSIVAKGKEDVALSIAQKSFEKGEFNRQDMAQDGSIITSDQVGKVASMNDVSYKAFTDKIQQAVELRDSFGLRTPETLAAFGGNTDYVNRAMSVAKDLKEGQEALAIETDPAKKQIISDNIDLNKIKLNDIIGKEDGSKYSKVYNEDLKTKATQIALAKEIADAEIKKTRGISEVTDNHRKGNDYQKALVNASVSDQKNNFSLDDVKNADKRVNDEYDAQVQAHIDYTDNKSSVQGKVEQFSKDLKAYDPTKETSRDEFIGHVGDFIKRHGELSDQIDMTPTGDELSRNATAAFNDMLAKANETKEDLRQGDETNHFEPMIAAKDTPVKEFKIPTAPDRQKIKNDIYMNQINRSIQGDSSGSLKSQQKEGWQDYKGAIDQVNNLEKQIKENKNAAFYKSKILSDPKMKEHLNASDAVMDDVTAQKYITSLDKSLTSLDEYKVSLLKESAKFNNYQDNIHINHMEKSKIALQVLTPLLKTIDSDLPGLIESMPDWSDADKDVNNPLADRGKLLKANKILVDIKTRIFAKGAEINSEAGSAILKKIISARNMKYVTDSYFGTNDYNPLAGWENFGKVMSAVNGEDFLNKGQKSVNATKQGAVDLGYIYTINLLCESLGANASKVEESRGNVDNINKDKFISSIEQQMTENLVFAFKNDANKAVTDFISNLRKIERDAIGKPYDAREKRMVDGLIFIRGEYKTGKTTQVLRNVFLIDQNYNKGKERKIAVIGISEGNREAMKQSLAGIKNVEFYLDSEFMGDPAKQAKALGATDIVIDEGSLLNFSSLQELKKLNEKGDRKFLVMGDDAQMKDWNDTTSYPAVEEAGIRTFPLMEKFSLDDPLVNRIANTWKTTANDNRSPVEAFTHINSDGSKQGAMYFKDEVDTINSFLKSTNPDRMLIVEDNDAWIGGLKDMVPESLHNKVYKIAKQWGEPLVPGELQSAQGLRAKEVYMAFDRNKLKDNGRADIAIKKAMYTAIGRASQWVGLIDAGYKDLNKNSAEEANYALRKPMDTDEQDIRAIHMDRMSTITGKTFSDEIGDSTVNTKAGKVNARGLGDEINPTVGKPYLVTGGEHDKLYAHMVKEEGGKFYFGVGKDPKEAEQHSVLDENLVVIDKANLAYITDAQKKDAEPEWKPDAPEKKEPIVVDHHQTIVERYTASKKDVWATTHSVIGDKNLTALQREMKRKSTPDIHSLIGKFFDANLVYHRNTHMEVEGGDKMMPAKDVLSVRLHMNKPKEKVLAELKKVLDPRAYDEIKTHLETNDELPEHYRNILTLAAPESAEGAYDFKDTIDKNGKEIIFHQE